VTRKTFVHPTAIVETTAIGKGTQIWAYAHVMKGAHVGARCNIGDHCFVETGAWIGDDCTIKNGNMIWDGVRLEQGVFVGPQVAFCNNNYPRSPRLSVVRSRYVDKRTWLVPTVIREGASLGSGAVILAGVTVGAFAMVGAGAVVTADVAPHALVVGNPARRRGWVCHCGHRLAGHGTRLTCPACGRRCTTIKWEHAPIVATGRA
jgi:acetyltransferase-like isoleucine patch superfamily enzyme